MSKMQYGVLSLFMGAYSFRVLFFIENGGLFLVRSTFTADHSGRAV
jgi:hypothetical protein